MLDQLITELNVNLPQKSAIHIRTVPAFVEGTNKFRPLSMSWWMSKPVQARLHEQVECGFNRKGLSEILVAYGRNPLEPRLSPCLEEGAEGQAYMAR
jgi:hypothetical protein